MLDFSKNCIYQLNYELECAMADLKKIFTFFLVSCNLVYACNEQINLLENFLADNLNNSTQLQKKASPFVSCCLYGQLGNQLFNLATTLAYSWDYNVKAFFPDLNKQDLNIPLNFKKIFFRLDRSPLPINPKEFSHLDTFNYVEIPFCEYRFLFGRFFHWKYFDHHRQRIIDTFSPSNEELEFLKNKHNDILQHPNSVGIHVRTFNKEWHEMIPFVGLDYYERAINYFPSDTLFVVFSDRINWCKHHFNKFNKNFVYIENQDHVDDFFLMSMLKHNIIGNSSFSWWAAYLNQNPNKMVIAPNCFVKISGIPRHVNLPEWITLDINLNGPYPSDIKNFDKFSTSIDTQ